MKKRLLAVSMIFLFYLAAVPATASAEEPKQQYELWTQSPKITTGMTSDEARIYKALELGTLRLVQLPMLGMNYYFALCEHQKKNAGVNNNKDLSDLYMYTLLVTEDGFIILDKTASTNEYYWNPPMNFSYITPDINTSFYISNNSEVPTYLVSFGNKYQSREEYDEYFIISWTGSMYKLVSQVDSSTEFFPVIANGILYKGAYKYKSGGKISNYYMPGTSDYAAQLVPMFFRGAGIENGTAELVPQTDVKNQNGYTLYDDTKDRNNMREEIYYKIPNTENLFFTIEYPRATRNGKSYYDLKATTYKLTNNQMTMLATLTHQTTLTYLSTASRHQLDGINRTFYANHNNAVPAVMLNSDLIICEDGSIQEIKLNSADSTLLSAYYIGVYNGCLALLHDRDKNNSSYYYKDSGGTYRYWQKVHPIYFSEGTMYLEPATDLVCTSSGNEGQNGHFSSYGNFTYPVFTSLAAARTVEWFGRNKSNIFPDGRYVKLSWNGIGGNIYELWYNIYNPDNTLRATGPTSYSTTYADSLSVDPVRAIAVNNTKFIAMINTVGNSWLKEYYRIAVVDESTQGEIENGGIGNKNILPLNPADTEPIQSIINFNNDDLPLGYNIRNNVIDSGKLEPELREQMNAIRLGDVVIITDSESYKSGRKDTGITLPTIDETKYEFGGSIEFRSNGQFLNWYCTNPKTLSAGSYQVSLTAGEKTLYLTVIVIDPPTNSGITSVIF